MTLGLSRTALAHPRFARPYRGVRELKSAPSETKRFQSEEAISAAISLVPRIRPGELFSHSTALALLGCPINIEPRPHVTICPPNAATVAAGVHGHVSGRDVTPWTTPEGLQIVPPTLAFVQAAGVLPFRELVVAADFLVLPGTQYRDSPPTVELDELRRFVASISARGIRRARAALDFARVGAESRMETLLRLLMARFGLDRLDLQVDVVDQYGQWIGRFDMVDLVRKLIIEYDGDQHRTSKEQYERDQVRLERAREAGFRILSFRRRHIFDEPLNTVLRISKALDVPPTPIGGALAGFFAE